MLHKLDKDGNRLWTKQAKLCLAGGIDLDKAGNIYCAGSFYGEGGFGNAKIVSKGIEDIFFMKLNPNGELLWLESSGAGYTDRPLDLVADKDGTCYTTGSFKGTVSFGTNTRTTLKPYVNDLYIYKIPAGK
jgi:hypothetical protein